MFLYSFESFDQVVLKTLLTFSSTTGSDLWPQVGRALETAAAPASLPLAVPAPCRDQPLP